MQTAAQIKQKCDALCGPGEKPVNHKSAGEDTQGLRHNASRWGKKIWFTASKHSPAQPSSVFENGVFLLMWCLYCSRAAVGVFLVFFRCDAADLRRAGAQYGQLGLCAALPPSWMLLLASGCTASDVTSSSHPSIHIWSAAVKPGAGACYQLRFRVTVWMYKMFLVCPFIFFKRVIIFTNHAKSRA